MPLCSLDTGRLNAETYRLFQAVEKHYGIHIEYTFPDAQETMDLVRAKGMFSFYEDGHGECCRIRKVRRRIWRCKQRWPRLEMLKLGAGAGAASQATAEDPQGLGHRAAEGPESRHTHR